MKTQFILATTLLFMLFSSEVVAQTFNTISDSQRRYKVEQAVISKQKEASLQSDTSAVDVPSPKDTFYKEEKEQIKYPLSVSYPLRQSKLHVSSPYGNRIHPILKVKKFHQGVDLRSKYEPVYAMLPGTVVKTGYDKVSGNFVTLQHASMRISYCHLSFIGVEKGATVYAGQPLGIAGTTGRSTGVHLHLTLKINGKPCDPMPLLHLIEKQLSARS